VAGSLAAWFVVRDVEIAVLSSQDLFRTSDSIPISDEPLLFRSSVLEIPMASVSFRLLFSAAVRGFLLSTSPCVTAASASTDLRLSNVKSSVLSFLSASFPVTFAVTESPKVLL